MERRKEEVGPSEKKWRENFSFFANYSFPICIPRRPPENREEKWETFFPLSSRMGSEGRERGGGGGGGQQPNSDYFCRFSKKVISETVGCWFGGGERGGDSNSDPSPAAVLIFPPQPMKPGKPGGENPLPDCWI